MGTPCFLRGAWRSDGLFWVLFLAAEKKCLAVKGETHAANPRTRVASKSENNKSQRQYLARGARTAMLNEKHKVNTEN